MKREMRVSRRFKTDLKKLAPQDRLATQAVVDKLQRDEPLEAKFRDHDLRGFTPHPRVFVLQKLGKQCVALRQRARTEGFSSSRSTA